MIFSMNAVQEYFKTHLERRTWQNFSGDTQVAAVETAQMDVQCATSQESLDLSDLLIFSAVCEQALFVAKRAAADQAQPDTAAQLKSESIEGIGKREYYQTAATQTAESTNILAPRAALFLSKHPSFRTLNLSRG